MSDCSNSELYKDLYLSLFNSITDALDALGKHDTDKCSYILREAQKNAKNFISLLMFENKPEKFSAPGAVAPGAFFYSKTNNDSRFYGQMLQSQ